MPDVYNILTKHFRGETCEKEEQQIAKFKKGNLVEYKLLAELWHRGDIKVKDFDSQKAWQIVQSKISKKQKNKAKVIPLYKKMGRVAAAAAILIIGTLSVYYFGNLSNSELVAANNTENSKKVLLSDGSVVWLGKGAILTYPGKFGKKERNVKLKGEAFFEVKKNPVKPFNVITKNSRITVLGTSFNVFSNADSTEVTVTSGKVKVNDILNQNNQIITAGYSAKVSTSGMEKYKTANINYRSWKTGEFIFEETPISVVIANLNKYYKKQIIIDEQTDVNCLLTADFTQTKIEEVIEIMQLTCDFNVIEKEGEFIINQVE